MKNALVKIVYYILVVYGSLCVILTTHDLLSDKSEIGAIKSLFKSNSEQSVVIDAE